MKEKIKHFIAHCVCRVSALKKDTIHTIHTQRRNKKKFIVTTIKNPSVLGQLLDVGLLGGGISITQGEDGVVISVKPEEEG